MKKVIFPHILFLLLLNGCEAPSEPERVREPWSNEAEVLFQQAEVLKYEVEQQRMETERLRAQGLEGAPPSPKR